jgi:predicted ester cyclase
MAAGDTIRKAGKAFDRHAATAVATVCAPKAVGYDPFYPGPLKGREAIIKDLPAFFTAFPDMRMKVVPLRSKGNTYGGDGESTGTHKGPLEGPGGSIPPTDRRVNATIPFFGRVGSRGLIVEERRHYDTAALMARLGIKPGS